MELPLIRPQWPAPARVAALCTTRAGGVSAAPFDSLNLGDHVGDEPAAVATNRERLLEHCPGLHAIAWLEQVHGTAVVEAEPARRQRADAQATTQPGLACAVMTADCLPVLFCDRAGRRVAAAHAGWRGLCAGVLEATAAGFAEPGEVLAWLGPAIGPGAFAVGPEVREAFLAGSPAGLRERIDAAFAATETGYLADLYALARARLAGAGIEQVFGGGACTLAEAGSFFSYRRDGVTGRMASLIYLMADESGA